MRSTGARIARVEHRGAFLAGSLSIDECPLIARRLAAAEARADNFPNAPGRVRNEPGAFRLGGVVLGENEEKKVSQKTASQEREIFSPYLARAF
jgi:hypothetical protein